MLSLAPQSLLNCTHYITNYLKSNPLYFTFLLPSSFLHNGIEPGNLPALIYREKYFTMIQKITSTQILQNISQDTLPPMPKIQNNSSKRNWGIITEFKNEIEASSIGSSVFTSKYIYFSSITGEFFKFYLKSSAYLSICPSFIQVTLTFIIIIILKFLFIFVRYLGNWNSSVLVVFIHNISI